MRQIKLTDAYLQELFLSKVLELQECTTIPTSMSVQINPEVKLSETNKVEVLFSNIAYKKMLALIDACSKEIGWHGIVDRKDQTHFEISDIIVFPQKVTGATVSPDEMEYTNWMIEMAMDETIDDNKIRFHGHSHVNMATSPSNVDTDYQDIVTKNIPDFYIFGIFNKSGSWWMNIFDFENNILYGKDDIKYLYIPEESQTWAKNMINKYVTEVQPVVTYPKTGINKQKSNMDYFDLGYQVGKVWDRKYGKYVWPYELEDKAHSEKKNKVGYKGVSYA